MIVMTITMTATIMIIMIRKRTITTLKITITITITINITITIRMMITMYEITSPLPNFNGCISEVWEWVNNFLPNFIMDYGCKYMYLSTPGLKLIHSSKGATSLFCSMQISDSKCEESDVRVLIIECLRWHSQNIKMTDNLRSRESVHTKSKQNMISRVPLQYPTQCLTLRYHFQSVWHVPIPWAWNQWSITSHVRAQRKVSEPIRACFTGSEKAVQVSRSKVTFFKMTWK